jgi:hypothetical protein
MFFIRCMMHNARCTMQNARCTMQSGELVSGEVITYFRKYLYIGLGREGGRAGRQAVDGEDR